MKKILLPLALLMLSACATPAPVPPDIRAAVAKIPPEKLQAYPITEQQRCGPNRHSFNNYSPSQRRECKYRIRREKAERKLMAEREAVAPGQFTPDILKPTNPKGN